MQTSASEFKIIDISIGTVALLASLTQLSYIIKSFNVFLQGVIAALLSVLIIQVQFKVPPKLYQYASFYFSFLGRGLLQILLATLVAHGGVLKYIAAVLLFFSGIVFIFCHFAPFIEEPELFRLNNGNGLSVGDDQFDGGDDDDEVI
ncbi:Tvp15p KNAG_0H03050 [Huiozyma naganishii CBS 8797]|uniref:Golgi apparatus membrane protein TVP15 n=1 Tax=Huiozyma naganishii (strain ATCC MYA-139 / BCRC 22969 / CBS 8797 / KCTC 17520 / NBRC 10181 / NCYC 3082 / Yp74L-3) TaxID=1071383 RepID=J7RA18_HUIN7|nr:hypothetical protein KNAG_0H03050 [Kazachstania naganishii CBS 8797]CCK71720.1 hypothetical protein KNAG_0H03050 [Kazachstania naganishii CBS 8797]